jgi:hypothetical protein
LIINQSPIFKIAGWISGEEIFKLNNGVRFKIKYDWDPEGTIWIPQKDYLHKYIKCECPSF